MRLSVAISKAAESLLKKTAYVFPKRHTEKTMFVGYEGFRDSAKLINDVGVGRELELAIFVYSYKRLRGLNWVVLATPTIYVHVRK